MGVTTTRGRENAEEKSVKPSNIEGNSDGDRSQAATYTTRLSLQPTLGSTEGGPLRHPSVSALTDRSRTTFPRICQASQSALELSSLSAVAVFDSLKHIFDQPPSGKY